MDENFSAVTSDPAIPPPPSSTASTPAPSSTPPPPPPVSPPPPQPPPTPPQSPPVAPKRPSALPKIILFAFLGLVIIGIAAFAFSKLGQIGSKKSQEITLQYWGLWESEQIIRPLLSEFEANHPGVHVQYTLQSPQEYRERLQSAMARDAGPDIFRIHNTWVPMFKYDVSPIPPEIYSAAEFESTFYPVAKKDLQWGTGLVGIPLEFDGLAMYINDDLLQRANLPVPQTWDDLKTSALALTQCDTPDTICKNKARIVISGASLGNTTNVDHWQDIISLLLLQNNVQMSNFSKTPKPVEDVLEYYRSFTSTQLPTWDTSFTSSTNEFALGRVAIYFGPSWRVIDIKKTNPSLKFSVYPVPQVPFDPTRQEQPKNWATYWVETVNRRSANPQMAWELLKFLSSKESQVKFHQAAISSNRPFGEPYSRKDLAATLQDTVYLNTFISQAPTAASWYLASYTRDGATGINSRVSALYASAISRKISVSTLNDELTKLLTSYGLSSAAP